MYQKKISIILVLHALLLILLWEKYPQVYLEESKYKLKKIQMSTFINTELESDSESGTDDELKSDFDDDSDNDSDIDSDDNSDNDSE